MPDASDIHMDEVLAGVKANPAAMQTERCVAELPRGDSRYSDVNRHSFHVEAMLRYCR